MSNVRKLPIDAINATGGTQSRAELNQATVAEYAEAVGQDAEFPPVVVFSDGAGGGNWLADGFHRYHAHRAAGLAEIICDIRVGTRRDAVLFSVGANASHGLRRTNEDKRNSVETLLRDPEWATWSNNAIAKACAVSDKTVASYRADHLRKSEDDTVVPTTRTVERNGTTYEQDTSKIGKPSAPPPAVSPTTTHAAASPSAPGTAPVPTPNLVQQVLDQQAADEEKPSPAEEEGEPLAEDAAPFDQLLADFNALELERNHLQAKNAKLAQHVELLMKEDLAAQVDGLVRRADAAELKFEQLSGRNRQLQQTARDAQLAEKRAVDQLAKIRKALGVESNAEILPALTTRRAA